MFNVFSLVNNSTVSILMIHMFAHSNSFIIFLVLMFISLLVCKSSLRIKMPCMFYVLYVTFLCLSFAFDLVYLTAQPQTRRSLHLPGGSFSEQPLSG